MLVAQYNVGDNVHVDGEDAIITRVDTESWVTGGVQPYYWVRYNSDGNSGLHAEEDINSGELPIICSIHNQQRREIKMAYVSQEDKKELSVGIKKVLKKYRSRELLEFIIIALSLLDCVVVI